LWATTLTAVAAAAAAIAGMLRYAGPDVGMAIGGAVAALAALGAIRTGQRIEKASKEALYHLAPNGHEGSLPPELRGRPLREVVTACWGRLEDGTVRFGEIQRWQDAHDALHAREP